MVEFMAELNFERAATERRPLRVAQLVETLTMGGAETLAVQIANARAAAGDRSHLYVMASEGILADRIDPAVHTRYLHYERASIRNPLAFVWSLGQGYQRLVAQLARDRIQIVQSHLPGANFWGLLLALSRRCAVVATIHNNAEFLYGEHDNPRRARLRRRAYRAILDHCDATVAVSEAVRESLLRDLQASEEAGRRLVVVTNGVQIPAALPDDERAALRARFQVPSATPLILAAGRFGEQKNFGLLVDALAALRRNGGSFHAIIAGEGPERSVLRARVASLGLDDCVQMPGNVVELVPLMQVADLVVLSSLWEGLPLVLLETMARGTAVVGTRIAGIVDVVADQINGVLVPPGDARALSDAMADLLASEAKRRRLGQSGRALIEQRFHFDRVSSQLGQIYAQLV